MLNNRIERLVELWESSASLFNGIGGMKNEKDYVLVPVVCNGIGV